MLILLPSTSSRYGVALSPSEVGFLISPAKPYSQDAAGRLAAFSWGLDNQCFTKGEAFDFDKYLHLLKRSRGYPGRCLFATVPDVVGDATRTHERWLQYQPAMHDLGIPLAYVTQDGLTELPNVDFACLFIGGTTQYKLSQTTVRLVAEAKSKGKWVHMGRVNTAIRMSHAYKIGVDSIDGTTWAIAPAREMRWALPHLRALKGQSSFDMNAVTPPVMTDIIEPVMRALA